MPSHTNRQARNVVRCVTSKRGKERPKVETHVQDAQDRFQERGRLANKSNVRIRRQEARRTYGGVKEAFA